MFLHSDLFSHRGKRILGIGLFGLTTGCGMTCSTYDTLFSRFSFLVLNLQNMRNLLRILFEQRRKRGEREMRVARWGRSAKKLTLVLGRKSENCESSIESVNRMVSSKSL